MNKFFLNMFSILSVFIMLHGIESGSSFVSAGDFEKERQNMVTDQIISRGIRDQRVLAALLKVRRHLFVPPDMLAYAYDDNPLPIGHNQTISQPYIVALMTELAGIKPSDIVLEIGTGSGYQAAILAELAKKVYSMDIVIDLADQAKLRLDSLGYKNIDIRAGDGYQGWPEASPFDAIIVTAAAQKIPEELIGQLKPGGRMIIPLGDIFQDLYVITKKNDGTIEKKHIIPVRFVPMIHGKS